MHDLLVLSSCCNSCNSLRPLLTRRTRCAKDTRPAHRAPAVVDARLRGTGCRGLVDDAEGGKVVPKVRRPEWGMHIRSPCSAAAKRRCVALLYSPENVAAVSERMFGRVCKVRLRASRPIATHETSPRAATSDTKVRHYGYCDPTRNPAGPAGLVGTRCVGGGTCNKVRSKTFKPSAGSWEECWELLGLRVV